MRNMNNDGKQRCLVPGHVLGDGEQGVVWHDEHWTIVFFAGDIVSPFVDGLEDGKLLGCKLNWSPGYDSVPARGALSQFHVVDGMLVTLQRRFLGLIQNV